MKKLFEDFFDELRDDEFNDDSVEDIKGYNFSLLLSSRTQPCHYTFSYDPCGDEGYDLNKFIKRHKIGNHLLVSVLDSLKFIDDYELRIQFFDDNCYQCKQLKWEFTVEEFLSKEIVEKIFNTYSKYDEISYGVKINFNTRKCSLDDFLKDINKLRIKYTDETASTFCGGMMFFYFNNNNTEIMKMNSSPNDFWGKDLVYVYDCLYHTNYSENMNNKDNHDLVVKYKRPPQANTYYARYLYYLDKRGDKLSDKFKFSIKGFHKEGRYLVILLDIKPSDEKYWTDNELMDFLMQYFCRFTDKDNYTLKNTSVYFVIMDGTTVERIIMKDNPKAFAKDDETDTTFSLELADGIYKIPMGRVKKQHPIDYYHCALNDWRRYIQGGLRL